MVVEPRVLCDDVYGEGGGGAHDGGRQEERYRCRRVQSGRQEPDIEK